MKTRKDQALAGRGTRRPPAPRWPLKEPLLLTKRAAQSPRGLMDRIRWLAIGELKPFPGNPRKHPDSQIVSLMNGIRRAWTNPILIDETGTVLAGHGRLEAAKRLGMSKVPTITVTGLSEGEKRALVIADNRLPERAAWDFDLLRQHFNNLIDLDFDVELTGFSTGEVDLVIDSKSNAAPNDPDDLESSTVDGPTVSKSGDMWEAGPHRLMCGDARRGDDYERLLRGDRAQMVVADPPYNVKIDRYAIGRGTVRHREFAMASGEMSEAAYAKFLAGCIRLLTRFSRDGSIHYLFIDWRHIRELLNAAHPHYCELKNILAWNKTNAGQGSFYRSKHELIAVFKNGTAAHINNFGLGGQGRYRTNVLDYPGVNSLHPARRGELELHPTVKPVALVADLIRDCSRRNGIILDPFCGSGTTILAAERTGRIARAIELDPIYVDIAIRRWERVIGDCVRHAKTGLSFAEIEAQRQAHAESKRSQVSIGRAIASIRGKRS
jgi:DNA modification methylase